MKDYIEKVIQGNQLAGSKIIRFIEEEEPEGIQIIKHLYPYSGKAYILGITGPPGAGKSTLVDKVIGEFRGRKMKVAVVAIDPSSPFTGGAILGDRFRMRRHSTDPNVFIRSMATRGFPGGLSKTTKEVLVVLDAMGFNVIIIETVGAGQDEVDVVKLSHTTVVVSIPGTGDEMQAIKAGIMEIGDIFVVNKADRPGAKEDVLKLQAMLDLRTRTDPDWRPPVHKTIALKNDGIAELIDSCLFHLDYLEKSGKLKKKRAEQDYQSFKTAVMKLAADKLLNAVRHTRSFSNIIQDLKNRSTDPYSAAEKLIEKLTVVK